MRLIDLDEFFRQNCIDRMEGKSCEECKHHVLEVSCERLMEQPTAEKVGKWVATKEMIKDMKTEKTKAIERPQGFTADTLAEHLKTIGSAIRTDADSLGHFADGGQSIRIEAEINPGEMVTMVTYTVTRNADPRTRTANHIEEGEEDE